MIPTTGSSAPIDRSQVLKAAASLGLLGADAGHRAAFLALLCNPKVSAKEIVGQIERQPALCARILRVANSPYYAHVGSVTSILRAIMVLGLDAVRSIAAAACVDRAFARRQERGIADIAALLRHSVATAVAAEMLAHRTRTVNPTEAFIAGLLHNLGIVIQACLDVDGVDALALAHGTNPLQSIRVLEADLCRLGHEECAAIMLGAWNLPPTLVVAIANHHAPAEAPVEHRELATLISWGARFACRAGYGFSLEFDDGLVEEEELANVASHQLIEVSTELPSRLQTFNAAFAG
jgi:HD-like signal output (HDOD) protein